METPVGSENRSNKARRPTSLWFLGLMALLTLLLAVGWLVVAMLAGKAGLREAVTSGTMVQSSVSQVVSRGGQTEDGATVTITYGTPEYYERNGQAELIAEMGADKYLLFVITEDHFQVDTPAPMPVLKIDGTLINVPPMERYLINSEHHRTRLIQFSQLDDYGKPHIGPETRSMEIQWPNMQMEHAADHSLVNPLRWQLPLAFPDVHEQIPLSPFLFLTLTAGLFAALSPCLIQLTVYYLSTLAAVSLTPGAANPAARWPVLRTALWFVAGIMVAYTAGGALAGTVGQYLQASGVLGEWSRPIAIVAGLLIVAMGIFTGAAARAPMLCKLPLPRLTRFAKGKGGLGTMLMGGAIALGCLSCFGGAIFASLLIYVGSVGSPLMGAGMLFLFSLGVAIPFLLAAVAWSSVAPHLMRMERITPYIALASSGMMILLGSLMIADKFHWVSNLLMRWMPFLQA